MSASLLGDETIPTKIQVDVSKLVNIPRNISQTISFQHDDKPKPGDLEFFLDTSIDNQEVPFQKDRDTLQHEIINDDINYMEDNLAKTGKIITAISENDSLIDVSTTNSDEIDRADTSIGIKHQLNAKHQEEEMVQADSYKDAWTITPIIIQSEDAQQDNSINIPISIERTQTRSKEDAPINIPIDNQREKQTKG